MIVLTLYCLQIFDSKKMVNAFIQYLYYQYILMAQNLNPGDIIKVGLGFWSSKVLLTAVHFELFTILAKIGKLSQKQIKDILGLKCTDRHVFDFLDTLVSLKFLHREGLLESALYSNEKETDLFLDKNKLTYVGGILEMANNRLYPFWGSLQEGLRTGTPQNQSKNGINIFQILYSQPDKLIEFVKSMEGVQAHNFSTFAQQFDFSKYKTLLDVGGCGGLLSISVAKNNPHMSCTTFDLPPIEPIAKANIEKHGVTSQVQLLSGDFFKTPFPKTDIIVMGNILHDWGQEQKDVLIKQTYEALNQGGAFVVIQSMIDNERKTGTMGMQMSLNMLIETRGGFNFTHNDFDGWAKSAGFKSTQLRSFGQTAVVAYK